VAYRAHAVEVRGTDRVEPGDVVVSGENGYPAPFDTGSSTMRASVEPASGSSRSTN
jgi:hypothetical protein